MNTKQTNQKNSDNTKSLVFFKPLAWPIVIGRPTLRKIFKETTLWVQGGPGHTLYNINVQNKETGACKIRSDIFTNKKQAILKAKELRKELIAEEIENEMARQTYARIVAEEILKNENYESISNLKWETAEGRLVLTATVARPTETLIMTSVWRTIPELTHESVKFDRPHS